MSAADRVASASLWARARQVLSVVRLRPFDVSTEAGRSLERYRRAALTTLMSFFGRGVNILATLVTVPLTLAYLGPERYGLWMTISSFVAMLAFTDLGIGGGLVGAVSEAHARGEREQTRAYVSSAVLMLCGVTAAVLAAFFAAYPFVPWGRVFNVDPAIAGEAGAAVIAFMLCQMAVIVSSVVGNVRAGFQEGFANAVWQAVGSVVMLVGVLAAVRARASLPWLIVVVMAGPLVGMACNAVVLVGRDHPEARPRWRAANRAAAGRLFRMGMLFFVLQFSSAMAYSSQNIVAAQVLGPDAVTQLSVPARLFGLPMLVVMTLVMPLWPAYTEAITRGDVAWVRRTLRRSLTVTVSISAAASAVLVVFGNPILHVWVGPQVSASLWLLAGMGVWNVLGTAGTTLSMLLNGAHVFRFQAWTALTMAGTTLVLSVALGRTVGLPGIVWGLVIAYSACCLIPWLIFIPKLVADIRPPAGGATDAPPAAGV